MLSKTLKNHSKNHKCMYNLSLILSAAFIHLHTKQTIQTGGIGHINCRNHRLIITLPLTGNRVIKQFLVKAVRPTACIYYFSQYFIVPVLKQNFGIGAIRQSALFKQP